MKIFYHKTNKIQTFLMYSNVFLKNTFDKAFFRNISNFDYDNFFIENKEELKEINTFSNIKTIDLEEDDSIEYKKYKTQLNLLYNNFKEVDLDFWKKEYEKLEIKESVKNLELFFDIKIEEDINVFLIPKNSVSPHNNFRMHSGVTHISEPSIIFIFIPEYDGVTNYKRLATEILVHEIAHLYIYRSKIYGAICEFAVKEYLSDGYSKIKIESICNEIFARFFVQPNIFGFLRADFDKKVLVEVELVDKMNITAHNILKESISLGLDKSDDRFLKIFTSNLKTYFK